MTNEEREQLPESLEDMAKCISPPDVDCDHCDSSVGFVCMGCHSAYLMRRAAQEIRRLCGIEGRLQTLKRYDFDYNDASEMEWGEEPQFSVEECDFGDWCKWADVQKAAEPTKEPRP